MRLSPLGFLLLTLPALGWTPARAQGPVILEPHDFSPNGAWRRRAASVRARRSSLLEQRDIRQLNEVRAPGRFRAPAMVQVTAATAVTGGFFIPVIAIEYSDRTLGGGAFDIADYQAAVFGNPAPSGRPYSLKTFYEELSRGRISMDGEVLGPVKMPQTGVYYTDGCNGLDLTGRPSCPSSPNRMGTMLVAALDSLSNPAGGDTLWSRYDNDGPDGIPNSGDDDGFVDFVTFLQPEIGGECLTLDPDPTGIWSHRWVISRWNGGVPYVTKTPKRGPNGQPIAGVFLKIEDYTIQSQLGGDTACDASAIMPVGTIAHETGHAFGLPDLYDISGSTQGTGEWSLMGSGNYSRPNSPSSYDPWSLHELGWITVDTLGTSRTVTTGARVLSDTVFYAATDNAREFVFLENRQALLTDSAQMNPDLPSNLCPPPSASGQIGCKKMPGMLVWLINRDKVLLFGVNSGFPHGVRLVQADGLDHLLTPGQRNRGDRGDPYPGLSLNTRLSLLSNPTARGSFGGYFGFIVDRVEQLADGVMRFRFTRREPSVVRAGRPGPMIRVNGQALEEYIEVVPAGDELTIGADEVQLGAQGRSRFRFLSWSNGGAREQTLSSPATPDTLVASFAAEHRVLVSSTGAGTVAATITGDLAQGIFVEEGVSVTLTATVPDGLAFSGWRGDTVTTSTTLVLPMHRGYNLQARFVPAVVVSTGDAVNELLGTPRLSAAQKSFLDELGNLNGFYDVGDLLAMLRRAGQPVPPAVAALARAPGVSKAGRP